MKIDRQKDKKVGAGDEKLSKDRVELSFKQGRFPTSK